MLDFFEQKVNYIQNWLLFGGFGLCS